MTCFRGRQQAETQDLPPQEESSLQVGEQRYDTQR